jgi:hypothetical protein
MNTITTVATIAATFAAFRAFAARVLTAAGAPASAVCEVEDTGVVGGAVFGSLWGAWKQVSADPGQWSVEDFGGLMSDFVYDIARLYDEPATAMSHVAEEYTLDNLS